MGASVRGESKMGHFERPVPRQVKKGTPILGVKIFVRLTANMSYFRTLFGTVHKIVENSAPVLVYVPGASVRARKSLKMRRSTTTDTSLLEMVDLD